MNKKEVIQALETIAVYMEIKGENTFKTSAYRKAAQALEQDERSLAEIENPASLSGIGKGTAAVIQELRDTGQAGVLETLKADIPEGLIPLLDLQGLGGRKVAKLYQELQITDAASLKQACESGHVRELSGFGAKTEEKILAALEDAGSRPERLPVAFMLETAEMLEEAIRGLTGIKRWARAGSLRRMEETVKDLDYILSVENTDAVRTELQELPHVSAVIADGASKVSLELALSYPVQVDFRLTDDDAFATTLHHFTGSKDHNVQIRQIAKSRGERVSEYGIENLESKEVTSFSSEEAFFHYLGLYYIPPEARRGADETITYQQPYETVERSDIKGDLHMHTTWSDGALSVEEMAEEVRSRGHEWMAVTDHSKFLQVAHGLDEERILRQIEEIRRVNEKYDDFTVLAGIEMDIRPDGTLDIEDEVLSQLDVVIASIHSSFSQSREDIMMRLDAALQHPSVNIIAHPTGRLIGRREGYDADVQTLLEKAAETGTALELNANPNRLDLSAAWLRKAVETNTVISINTDAHTPKMLDHMEIGTASAKKALLQKEQILNTRNIDDLRAFLEGKKERTER
ncbi:DNA polymerase/3'-5' exonuclease PolX [Salibacterium halotolerans]|uniref:DNA-directed DNA polymerase n=1 Tax=Salibacterium halotolerans TaxID=1884432 RepID=A0A1I5SMS1_9BACI|nr:DNA polymerase/3'-5' exonuclease PolX [Salibacterium halotolerans]SFP72008.1 DNA polymerase (family 10) [Salibacterium halotolerans]